MSNNTISEYQFLKQFDTEEKAVTFFEQFRWSDGHRMCPRCGGDKTYPHKSRSFYYRCPGCRKDFMCKVNTIMHASPLPVRMWLYALYKISVARKGIASIQLAKELGITQKSAWHMLHRIKEACGGETGPLSGIVEADETFIGGKERNKHQRKKLKSGTGWLGKQAVLGLREQGGRTKAMLIHGTDRATLEGAVRRTVTPGSTVCTDEHSGYAQLPVAGYQHRTVRHALIGGRSC